MIRSGGAARKSYVRRFAGIGAVVLALTGAAVIGHGSVEAATARTVRVQDIDFHPKALAVTRGSTVRWLFRDGDTPHNVKSRGALRFRSSPTKTSGSWSVRFVRAGTYRYVCTIHFNMKGRIVVR